MPSVLFNPTIELIDENGFCRMSALVDRAELQNKYPALLSRQIARAYEEYVSDTERLHPEEKEEKCNEKQERKLVNRIAMSYSLAQFLSCK